MLLVTPVHSRRVLVLGAAGLVPAALVTLLFVHQPSIGDRRLYPLLRGSLTLVGLGLALAALITWATASDRLSRSSLSGLAWAGLTTILCIGPFLESNPRPRLYALDPETGELMWARSEADTGQVSAGGASVPGSEDGVTESGDGGINFGPARVDGNGWSKTFPGERVHDVARVGDSLYVYVATPGAAVGAGGRILKLDAESGDVVWPRTLPEVVAVTDGQADIAANDGVVVVAGGVEVAGLDADTGRQLWTASVVELGKSRGYALPGAVQAVAVSDDLVLLSTTPET
jgi:outer membrane protein assembly factor BamB